MGLGGTSCLFLLFTGLEICNPDLRVWIADLQTKQFQQKQRASISLPNKHTQCDPDLSLKPRSSINTMARSASQRPQLSTRPLQVLAAHLRLLRVGGN